MRLPVTTTFTTAAITYTTCTYTQCDGQLTHALRLCAHRTRPCSRSGHWRIVAATPSQRSAHADPCLRVTASCCIVVALPPAAPRRSSTAIKTVRCLYMSKSHVPARLRNPRCALSIQQQQISNSNDTNNAGHGHGHRTTRPSADLM